MPPDFLKLFDRPVIILAAPRSGSTLLYETLAEAGNAWTIGGESHHVIESIPALNPNSGQVESNRLDSNHASEQVATLVRMRFARLLKDRNGREFFHNREIQQLRFLEKTPKNALRLPFLNAIFPDALYIYLFRDVRENLSSMMEAWRARRWVTYPRLPGWQGPPWSLLLPPGWQNISGSSLAQICAFQWDSANRILLNDLEQVPRHRWTAVSYKSLLDDTEKTVNDLCDWSGLELDERLRTRVQNPLPLSRLTQTQPAAEKWRKNEAEIELVLPSLEAIESRMTAVGYRRSS